MQSKQSILRKSIISGKQHFRRLSITEEQWATIKAAEEIVSVLDTNEKRFFFSGITMDEWQRITCEVDNIIEIDERERLNEEYDQFNFYKYRGIIIKIARECGREEKQRQENDLYLLEYRELKCEEEWQLAMKVIKEINEQGDCKCISDIHKFAIKLIWGKVHKELEQEMQYEADSDRASDEWAMRQRENDVGEIDPADRWEQGFDSAEYDPSTGFPVWYKDDD